jgi:hypothetical protein
LFLFRESSKTEGDSKSKKNEKSETKALLVSTNKKASPKKRKSISSSALKKKKAEELEALVCFYSFGSSVIRFSFNFPLFLLLYHF